MSLVNRGHEFSACMATYPMDSLQNQSNKPYVLREGDSILESEQLVGRMRLNTCQEFP